MRMKYWLVPAILAAASACDVTVKDEADSNAANQVAEAPAPTLPPMPPAAIAERDRGRAEFQDLRFLVDKSERKLSLFAGERLLEQHDVTVGTRKYPTRAGTWKIHRVDINPEWIPPKEEPWAKDETRKGPGDPENPMGRARLVYDGPRTIHGTDETGKLGERGSHGSIRVANAVVLPLAEKVLKAGNAWQGADWFGRMTSQRTREHKIELETPVPIKVVE
jgi:L,D-transpeptidase catalytic domain